MRRILDIVRLFSIVVIVPILAIGCDVLPGAVTDLKVGDCFDQPTEQGEVADVQHRPCGEPHDAEVIAVPVHPAGSEEGYPVVFGFDDFIQEQCIPAFETYSGRTFATETELELGYFHPTLSGWGDGDRGFTCHVNRVDGQKITGSVRAGAPPSP